MEKEDQGGQREKLDQRWVTCLLSLSCLFVLFFSFNFSSLQGNSGNDGPPGPPGERVCTIVYRCPWYKFPFYIIIQ